MSCIAAFSKALQEFSTAHWPNASTRGEVSAVTTSKQTSVDHREIDIANESDEVCVLRSVRAEADLGFEILDEKDIGNVSKEKHVKQKDVDGVKQTCDDLRAGPFRYLMVSGRLHLVFV